VFSQGKRVVKEPSSVPTGFRIEAFVIMNRLSLWFVSSVSERGPKGIEVDALKGCAFKGAKTRLGRVLNRFTGMPSSGNLRVFSFSSVSTTVL